MSLRMTISGIQEAMRRNLALVRALRLGTPQGEAVRAAAQVAHREAVIRTHVITGALRASHRVYIRQSRRAVVGIITPDPEARNPLTGQRPAVYGLYEEKRGGSHAFYGRTVREAWRVIATAAARGGFDGIRRTRP